MSKFKVGDKVRILPGARIDCVDPQRHVGDVFTIAGEFDEGYRASWNDADWYTESEIELVIDTPQTDLTELKADLEKIRRRYIGYWRSRHNQDLVGEKLFVILERYGLMKEPEPEKTVEELTQYLIVNIEEGCFNVARETAQALKKKLQSP